VQKRFSDANQAGVDLLGYPKEELLQMCIADVDCDPVVVLPAHAELLSGGRLLNYEHRLRRKDGTIVTVLNNSKPLTDVAGNVVGMLSTLIDISARKQTEELLAQQLDELRRWQAVTLGREGRVAELKSEVNALAARLAQPPPYATPEDSPAYQT
jgi:PAS domain S-box-containing protein